MKKYMKFIAFAGLAFVAGAGAGYAAPATVPTADVCTLIKNLGGVYTTLKTLAFAGAAFILAGWAWVFISKGYDADGAKLEDAKKKGIGMLIGFTLLFSIALVLQFLPNMSSCPVAEAFGTW